MSITLQTVEKVYQNTKLFRHIIRIRRRGSFCEEATKHTHIGFASVAGIARRHEARATKAKLMRSIYLSCRKNRRFFDNFGGETL